MPAFDLISAIELAYDRTSDEATWLSEVTNRIAPAFVGPTDAITSFVFDITKEHDVELGTTVVVGAGRHYGRKDYELLHDVCRKYGPVDRMYTGDPYTLASRVVGAGEAQYATHAAGMVGGDAIGLRANATPTSGVMLTTNVRDGQRLRRRELWTRFAAHLGAALRLRRSKDRLTADTAPAVLSPNGRLEHGNAETIAAGSALATAARAMDRARGKLRKLDPDAASALWRTMVQSEWSLVDWYDHDGKRFLLAEENLIPNRTKRVLTQREEQVVACAAMGHSNKLIAYDLGITTGSVAVLIGRAARKLGVSGRVALVRAFRESYRP